MKEEAARRIVEECILMSGLGGIVFLNGLKN